MDSYHTVFSDHVGQIIEEVSEGMYGFPLISLIHDLWTNASVRAVLGASISFIDATWKKRYITLLYKRHVGGHGALPVSLEIKRRLKEEYPVAAAKVLPKI